MLDYKKNYRKYIVISVLLMHLIFLQIVNIFANDFTSGEFLNATDTATFGIFALTPDIGDIDQSDNLTKILEMSIAANKKLYVPSGNYVLKKTILIKSNTAIYGDETKPTIFLSTTNDAVQFKLDGVRSPIQDVSFVGIYFDGVHLFSQFSKNIIFERCVFYNIKRPFMIDFQASENFRFFNNILLKDIAHTSPGDSMSRGLHIAGYENQTTSRYDFAKNVYINDNLFGARLDELDALKTISSNGLKDTISNLQKSYSAKQVNLASNDQNYFTCAINSFRMLKNADIMANIFYSFYDNEKKPVGDASILQDHLIYLRGSQDVNIVGNHARGSQNGPAGGFKIKSGKNIVFMKNYFRNTGIILYTTAEYGYDEFPTTEKKSILEHIFIASNTFDWKYWDKAYAIGIEYNDPDILQTGKDSVFIDNKYVHFNNITSPATNVKRNMILMNAAGSGFKPTDSHISGNTRDDGANGGVLLAEGWASNYAEVMEPDYRQIYSPARYSELINVKTPVLNTLPKAKQNLSFLSNAVVSAESLITNATDQDDTNVEMHIVNSELLTQVGKQTLKVKIDYPNDGYFVEVFVPVDITKPSGGNGNGGNENSGDGNGSNGNGDNETGGNSNGSSENNSNSNGNSSTGNSIGGSDEKLKKEPAQTPTVSSTIPALVTTKNTVVNESNQLKFNKQMKKFSYLSETMPAKSLTAVGKTIEDVEKIRIKIPKTANLRYGVYVEKANSHGYNYCPSIVSQESDGTYMTFTGQIDKVYILASTNYTFLDLDKAHWAYNSIINLYDRLLVNGYEDDTFRPNALVTRAEFATIVFNAFYFDEAESRYKSKYSDVSSGTWYNAPINKLEERGILTSFTENNFLPNQPITREEMANILNSAIKNKKLKKNGSNRSGKVFSDSFLVNPKYKQDVEDLSAYNILNGSGDNQLKPTQHLTRAEASTVIYSTIEILNIF